MQVRAAILPSELQRIVKDLAFHLCQVGPDGALHTSERWSRTVTLVEIKHKLDGGRSPAIVLDARVTRSGRPAERVIIKIDKFRAVAAEWRAVRRVQEASESADFTVPVVAVSRGIEDPAAAQLPDHRAGIVYRHVADSFPYADLPLVTLEQLVRDGTTDGNELADLITQLNNALHNRLWRDDPRDHAALHELNAELGPDLVVQVNQAQAHGRLVFVSPEQLQRRPQVLDSQDILEAATGLGPAGRTTLAPNDWVEFRGGDPEADAAGTMVVRLPGVSVLVHTAGEAVSQVDLREHATAVADGSTELVVVGRVAQTRAGGWWDRIQRCDPAVQLDDDSIKFDGVRVGQPFHGLVTHFTETRAGRATGLTHGDLNPRNVLIVGGRVYLIDFDRSERRPPMTDPAWLEVCLLRDVYAEQLGSRRLVRLQRLLGFASRIVDAMPPHWDAAAKLVTGDPAIDTAFRTLWSIRSGARTWHRGRSNRAGWWHDYLVHVKLAALRSLKFDDPTLSTAPVYAVLAAAGVAAECLGGAPYRYWVHADLRHAALLVLQDVRPAQPETGVVVEGLVTAIDRASIADDQVNEAIARCRDACVPIWYGERAREMLVAAIMERPNRPAHEYIDLRAIVGRPADEPHHLDSSGERYELPVDQDAATAGPVRTPALLDATSAVELATRHTGSDVVVIVGGPGSGKSMVAREVELRYAAAVAGRVRPEPGSPNGALAGTDLPPMLPVSLTANQIVGALSPDTTVDESVRMLLATADGQHVQAALRIGGVHLTVDGFDHLDPGSHGQVTRWIRDLHDRYPRTRVLLCHRGDGYNREELPFLRLVLQGVSSAEASAFFRSRFRAMGRSDSTADDLMRALTDPEVSEAVRELVRTPLFLGDVAALFLTTGSLPDRPGDLVRQLSEQYLRGQVDEQRPPGLTYKDCMAALHALATRDGDANGLTESEALTRVASVTPHALEMLDLLLNSKIIVRTGAEIRFYRRAFRQYFAVAALNHRALDVQSTTSLLLSFQARSDIEDLVRFSDHSRELIHTLIGPAMQADPVFAARMLRSAGDPDPEDVQQFVDDQQRVLFGPSGVHAWSGAVDALFAYGGDPAWHRLHQVVRSADASPPARSAALAALLRMRGGRAFDRHRSRLDSETTETVRRLLEPSVPEELRVQAANAVVDGPLRHLIAYLADLVNDTVPWPVMRAARRSLLSLDQVLTPRQNAVYQEACVRRLPWCEAERLAAVDRATIELLYDERWELIDALSRAGRLDLVLPVRFSFDPGHPYYRADRRRLAMAPRDCVPEPARSAWDVLRGDHSPADLVASFARGDDLEAVAAAHRLLAEEAGEARSLVDYVSADSSALKLLAVAATMLDMDDDQLNAVRDIVEALLTDVRPERLEPIAALLDGLPPHKRSTKRLALRAVIAARELSPAEVHGPIERVFHASPRWGDAEIAGILRSGAGGRDLVIRGLSMVLYASDAREPGRSRLMPAAEQVLRDYQPQTAIERVHLVRACTAAGLSWGLDHAFAAVDDPATADVRIHSTHPRYGAEIVSGLGDVLACIGYLGRLVHDEGRLQDSKRAHRCLDRFDPSPMDRTVRRGRLVGLAILGDWPPLLEELGSDDRPAHRAARNAIGIWCDGPYAPSWGRSDTAIAEYIGGLLAQAENQIAPDVRSALAEVKTLVERRIGRIVLPPP